ncbi:MAG: cadmium-translocating P-type ATPase [Phycisphaerales bacterium]|nr:cadmium-translocating P-type ATPase [Phycisphaerales bacterium]
MPDILKQPLTPSAPSTGDALIVRRDLLVACLATLGILASLVMRFIFRSSTFHYEIPLLVVLVVGGGILWLDLLRRILRGNFGADLLAGFSIVASLFIHHNGTHQYLAGAIVVLMLSGGTALEAYAIRSASSVLRALAKRMPSVGHVQRNGSLVHVSLSEIHPGDIITVFPHETCPADARVIRGHGSMDESFLTGEPYGVPKTPGSEVLSGAINGEAALELQVLRAPADSRYEAIMRVMRDAEQRRPRMRRLADRLGAWYTPAAVLIALLAWYISQDPTRFLAVLVVATPCPLIIAIPVAIIGTVSLAARRGIVIRDPAVLERIDTCTTVFFDKTGTLTYGRPRLTELLPADGFDRQELLALVAGLEQYSRHPLAHAVVEAAKREAVRIPQAIDVSEPPGHGLTGTVNGSNLIITGRSKVPVDIQNHLPPIAGGLECVVLLNNRYAALLRFQDEPRADVTSFISHLGPQNNKHKMSRIILLTGDREDEAQRMAQHAGIKEVFAGKTPEEKLEIVRSTTAQHPTLYLGDGINDAPAMLAATAAIAFGANSDVTSEAAGAVILEPSFRKLDELLHIARRLRSVAMSSAVGGMALSIIAITLAALGLLVPVAGALFQELIDLVAVLNALRAALPPKELSHI